MAGLTVVGDIKVLYDSVQVLEQKLKNEQENQNKNYKLILVGIVERLEKLEAICCEGVILQEVDTSWDVVHANQKFATAKLDQIVWPVQPSANGPHTVEEEET